MDYLVHIRKDFTSFDQAQFADAILNMHKYELHPELLTAETIADLEDVTGDASTKSKYPVSLLQEIALFATRIASVPNSRLIELDDIVGFRARSIPDYDYVPPVVQEHEAVVAAPTE